MVVRAPARQVNVVVSQVEEQTAGAGCGGVRADDAHRLGRERPCVVCARELRAYPDAVCAGAVG